MIKEYVTQTCENCKKKINSPEEWQECFDRGHTIRTYGQGVVDTKLSIQGRRIIKGTALTNAEAGEEVLVRLE